ncbi:MULTISPECIES: FecR family protein [Bacteroides]|uniref:FecR family protein n=1 Tax=Bacteroides TaxID=816 RepID=UPI00189D92C6|nr:MULTISPECIES: FecR family protein [Bacteroides]MDC2613760.1 FecR family protein [Bacteroides ovatus]MDC2632910.1 FecR family protein [Bacteroides ovatus]
MKENSNIWDLLAKRTDHSLSKEEEEALERLLEEDASLHRASRLVDESQVKMDTHLLEETMNRTWDKVETGMKTEKKHRSMLLIRRYAAAACIATLFILGGLLGYQTWSKPDMLIVMNQGKEALLFTLPDNSKVWLGGGSRLKYPDKLSARGREVYLEGEAFFDVKKDNGRTFQVITDVVEVTVLGTRFDVKVSKSEKMAEVVLESGSVQLNECNETGEGVILRPGEMGRVRQQSGIEVHHVDLQLYTTWKDKYMNIESQKMENVMFMLSKRYHTEIRIEGDDLKEEIFSGRFDIEQTLDNIFETIRQMTPIHYQKQADGTYLVTPK